MKTLNTDESNANTANTTATQSPRVWAAPTLIDTIEDEGSIALIYSQASNLSNNYGTLPPRIFKIIYSVKDGQWHKSEQIFGTIIPAQPESYNFDNI